MEKRTSLFAITLLVLYSTSASAAVLLNISNNPVDCGEPAKVTAILSEGASLLHADFFVDNYRFNTKNLKPGFTEVSASMDSEDWDHIKPGLRLARVEVYRIDKLVDEGYTEFVVGGRRCQQPEPTSTTTIRPLTVTCSYNTDCPPTIIGTPTCEGSNVTQAVTWWNCDNPGTAQSKCAEMYETVTLEACSLNQVCEAGSCENTTSETTSTTTTETTSTTTTTETTATTQAPTTTTQPQKPPSTSTTQKPIFTRTNTKLDRIIELLETILQAILFWK
ncbi:MAG: hypothetical protein V1744_06650 [Candidatus Altiarchaeota archaeon]